MKHSSFWRTFLCLCMVLYFGAGAQAREVPNWLVKFNKEQVSIESEILGEKRSFTVHLPPSYQQDSDFGETGHRKYPLVYILDGKSYSDFFSAIIGNMGFTAMIPEMIVVGIESNFSITSNRLIDTTPTKANPNSQGDPSQNRYGGGADKFFDYLGKELIPYIDKHYRTMKQRTFIGHSIGGLAVLYNFLSRPGMFQHYLSIDASAWWDDQIIYKLLKEKLDKPNKLAGRIFMAVSEKETTGYHDDSAMLLGNLRYADLLKRDNSPDIDLKLKVFPATNHGTVVLPGFYEGMLHIWGGYYLPAHDVMHGGFDRILDHYKTYSERMGAEFVGDELHVNSYARKAAELADKEVDPEKRAYYQKMQRDVLEFNLKIHPKSSRALVSVAEYHVKTGNKNKAMKYYKKALQLDADYQPARSGMDKLTRKAIELTQQEKTAFLGKYAGEGFPPAEIVMINGELKLKIDGIDLPVTLLAKSSTELYIPENMGSGTLESIRKNGKVEQLILHMGNGTFTLSPVMD